MKPKWSQNRTQDGPKPKITMRSKKADLEDRLGAVLGRSWVVLSAVLRSKSCSRPRWRSLFVFEHRLFGEHEGSRGDLGRSWVDLGGQEGLQTAQVERRKGHFEISRVPDLGPDQITRYQVRNRQSVGTSDMPYGLQELLHT